MELFLRQEKNAKEKPEKARSKDSIVLLNNLKQWKRHLKEKKKTPKYKRKHNILKIYEVSHT